MLRFTKLFFVLILILFSELGAPIPNIRAGVDVFPHVNQAEHSRSLAAGRSTQSENTTLAALGNTYLDSSAAIPVDSFIVIGNNTGSLATATLNIISLSNTQLVFSVTNTSPFDARVTAIGFDLASDSAAAFVSAIGGVGTFTFCTSCGFVPGFTTAVLDFGLVTANSFAGGNPNLGTITGATSPQFTISGNFTGLTQQEMAGFVFVRFQYVGPAGDGSDVGRVPLTLADKAAALAKSLLNAPYGYGGKGYDFTIFSYVNHQVIFDGYNYYKADCINKNKVTLSFDTGVDCSGLVLWAYNTAAGASTQFLRNNPILFENADGQFKHNTNDVNEADLRPGDLMFFDFNHDGRMDHVAMYVGGDDVVEAPDCGVPIRLRSKSLLRESSGFLACGPNRSEPCFRRVTNPTVGLTVRTHSPVSLSVTDPDGFTVSAETLIFTEREVLREIPGVLYYFQENNLDDTVLSPSLKPGVYFIRVIPKAGALSTDTYGLVVEAPEQVLTLAENVSISEIPILGYGIESSGNAITLFSPVVIDIKPDSLPNPITVTSDGKIPVAILSNRTFNATTQTIRNSLTFGRTGTENSLAFCNSAWEDVNRDGLPDLICHFYTQRTVFEAGHTKGILKGMTIGGQLFRGEDSVRVVP